jgi:hypothetical protein
LGQPQATDLTMFWANWAFDGGDPDGRNKCAVLCGFFSVNYISQQIIS